MAGSVPAIHVFSNGGRKPAILLVGLVAWMERSDIRDHSVDPALKATRISLVLNPGYNRLAHRERPHVDRRDDF
jgi:hypothetical protein